MGKLPGGAGDAATSLQRVGSLKCEKRELRLFVSRLAQSHQRLETKKVWLWFVLRWGITEEE